MANYAAQRETMVASQLRPNRVTSSDVLRAFATTSREAFLPNALKPLAYMDDHLLLSPAFVDAPGRYCLSPMMQAWLLQAVRITKSDAALDVGCGCGVSAALLAALANRVDALEENETLATFAKSALADQGVTGASVRIAPLTGNGLFGGPYNVIIVNGGVPQPPEKLFELLADDGRLACVITRPDENRLVVFEKTNKVMRRSVVWDASAPPLTGFAEKSGFLF
ncbi:MAG: methyltransferase [Hyphomicrobiales bacterium]|nr:methyltransferase [Hyphomicrobiales bacterium]